jgi:adenylate cyclase
VETAKRGLRHSPLDTRVFWPEAILGQAFYVDGNYEQAVYWTKKALSHAPTAIFNLRTLTASLVALGKPDEARWIADRLLRILPDFRLGPYIANCPFRGENLTTWISRLREAGLPD